MTSECSEVFLGRNKSIGIMTPNIVAGWLALLLYIQEISGSNLNPETGYPDRFFVVFLSPSKQMLE
jgi:hypothetical protein